MAPFSELAYVDSVAFSQKQGNGGKRHAKPKGS